MDKIIMSELQLIFLSLFYSGGWSLESGVWEKCFGVLGTSPTQSSSIVYSDRAGHLAFHCSTLFGIVLGRHARMLATLCCVSVQQPVETAMLGLTCMSK